MSEVKEFKTESKRLLDLMVNSIYTNKEIFLRELISNASDAIDKYHYMSLVEEKLPRKNDYEIFLSINKKGRTITIKDNGIGMTKEDLENKINALKKHASQMDSNIVDVFKYIKFKAKIFGIKKFARFGEGYFVLGPVHQHCFCENI